MAEDETLKITPDALRALILLSASLASKQVYPFVKRMSTLAAQAVEQSDRHITTEMVEGNFAAAAAR